MSGEPPTGSTRPSRPPPSAAPPAAAPPVQERALLRGLDQAIWWCIYGGLLVAGLGMAIWKEDPTLPVWLLAGGLSVAVVGLVLIVVRARQTDAGRDPARDPGRRP